MVATLFNSRTIKKRELTHGHEGNEGGTRSSKKKREMRVQREIKSRTYRERGRDGGLARKRERTGSTGEISATLSLW